jgi:hypothetical protein
VYVEGTLYPSISLLEIERDIMPTPQGMDHPNVQGPWAGEHPQNTLGKDQVIVHEEHSEKG